MLMLDIEFAHNGKYRRIRLKKEADWFKIAGSAFVFLMIAVFFIWGVVWAFWWALVPPAFMALFSTNNANKPLMAMMFLLAAHLSGQSIFLILAAAPQMVFLVHAVRDLRKEEKIEAKFS
ncbi:MAG: hypothetical protein OWS74_00470, partial [Firmicutes bacterium]|nr:hypothetical protein [Bacillota bacterium]